MLITAHEAQCSCGHTHLCTSPVDPDRRGVETWLEQCASPIVTRVGWPKRSEIHAHYLHWCDRQGVIPLTERRFYGRLRSLGVRETKSSIWRMNLQLLPSP